MSQRDELALYRDDLLWILGRTVDAVRDAGARSQHHPDAAGANSVAGIATHAMGAAQEHVLGWALGRRQDADVDAFVDASPEEVEARFHAVERLLAGAFETLAVTDLDRLVDTPGRGPQSVRAVLQWAMLHAAEHAGAAELTRDLVVAVAESPQAPMPRSFVAIR